MKIPAFILLLLLAAKTGFTQPFFPVPGPVLEKEVAFNQANECYIFFNNPSGDSLQLRWRSLSADMPQGWAADLCDYGLCYVGIPPNGTMNPVFDTVQPYLKLIVQPGNAPGSAWFWFRVFEKDNEDNYADVYFSLFTPGTTAVYAPGPVSLAAFPNPVRDLLFIENKETKGRQARLLDMAGRPVRELYVPPGDRSTVEVGTLPGGAYFLHVAGEKVQKIIKRP